MMDLKSHCYVVMSHLEWVTLEMDIIPLKVAEKLNMVGLGHTKVLFLWIKIGGNCQCIVTQSTAIKFQPRVLKEMLSLFADNRLHGSKASRSQTAKTGACPGWQNKELALSCQRLAKAALRNF